jgi:hypothetical protein
MLHSGVMKHRAPRYDLEFSDCGGVLATEQALCRNRRYHMGTLLHVIEIWGGVNGVLVLLLLGRRPRRSHVLVAGRPIPAHGPHDGTDADVPHRPSLQPWRSDSRGV